jgi:hypothetical protein
MATWTIRGSILREGKRYISSPIRPDRLHGPPGGGFPGSKSSFPYIYEVIVELYFHVVILLHG